MGMHLRSAMILATVALQGCGSMMVGAPAPSGSKEPQTELHKAVQDEALTADVKSEFLRDSRLRPYSIWVDCSQGVVTLTGSVDSYATRAWAGSVAARVRGVVTVDNQLSVGTGYH